MDEEKKEEYILNMEARITRLEVMMGELKSDIENISRKLDEVLDDLKGDFIDRRIEDKLLQLTGRMFWRFLLTIVGTSGFITFLLEVLSKLK
jgi:hypothetical protein